MGSPLIPEDYTMPKKLAEKSARLWKEWQKSLDEAERLRNLIDHDGTLSPLRQAMPLRHDR